MGVVAAHDSATVDLNAGDVHARTFDESSEDDWKTLGRDITAMANSGGGHIELLGTLQEPALRQWLAAGDSLELSVMQHNRVGVAITDITIRPALFPIGFAENRTEAFYVRRGGRTELATSADMQQLFERSIRRVGRRWQRRIRRLLNAPLDHVVRRKRRPAAGGLSELTERKSANLKPVRIVTDPDAPPLHPQDIDRLYPWRQKDLVRELNRRIGRRLLNSYDIQAVRRHHRLDSRPEFIFNLLGAGRRYSPAAADWIMDAYSEDPEFFQKSRAADQDQLKLRRQKPR